MTDEQANLIGELLPPRDGKREKFWTEIGTEVHRQIEIMLIVSHNPQRLLTDQRTPEKKQADDLVSAYREMYPDVMAIYQSHAMRDMVREPEVLRPNSVDDLRAFYDRPLGEPYVPRKTETVSTPTGRWVGDRFSRGGFIETRWPRMAPLVEPNREIVMREVDFARLEERALASMALTRKPTFAKPLVMTVDTREIDAAFANVGKAAQRVADTIALAQDRMKRRMSDWYDREVMKVLFGDVDLSKPEPNFDRERRIAKLLLSKDRRQYKRGERLFADWQRSRPGINYVPHGKR